MRCKVKAAIACEKNALGGKYTKSNLKLKTRAVYITFTKRLKHILIFNQSYY